MLPPAWMYSTVRSATKYSRLHDERTTASCAMQLVALAADQQYTELNSWLYNSLNWKFSNCQNKMHKGFFLKNYDKYVHAQHLVCKPARTKLCQNTRRTSLSI